MGLIGSFELNPRWRSLTMKNAKGRIAILAIAVLLSACGAVEKRDSDFSGTTAFVKLAPDIPGVPVSNGKQVHWSSLEIQQVLHLDASCQKQLYDQLPGQMQALVKEGGWNALAVAVGEGLFASAFPGAQISRYVLGGAGLGAALGTNVGRSRQESSVKIAQADCMMFQMQEARRAYPGTLNGVGVVRWVGNGQTKLPAGQ